MQKIRNSRNFLQTREEKKVPACCIAKSLTVPRLSLTVDELISRFERGVPLPMTKAPIYSHDAENIDARDSGRSLSSCDLIDISYVKKSYLERREMLEKAITAQEQANAEAIRKRRANYDRFLKAAEKIENAGKGDSGTNTP